MNGLEYLESLEKWKGEGKFSPDTTRRILEVLKNPQDSFSSIHVAGTNGKGSTSTFCASILGAAGYKVGLTLSPHLNSPTERIIIDGKEISLEKLNFILESVKTASDISSLRPTYHEALTIAAFVAFKEEKCDWGVVEVGLGGRLDSTNVIKSPKVVIITSIGIDHEAILGDTIELIAKEKAGIIKNNCPVVTGEMSENALNSILEIAERSNSINYAFGNNYSCSFHDKNFEYREGDFTLSVNPNSLYGEYQASNIGASIKASRIIGLKSSEIVRGIEEAFLPGRFEEVHIKDSRFILDSAHNPQAFHSLLSTITIRNLRINSAIFGVLHTKNWRQMCQILSTITKDVALITPMSESAANEEEVTEALSGFGVRVKRFGVDYSAAIDFCSGKGTTLVCGSMYFLGPIRDLLGIENRAMWSKNKNI